MRLSRLRFSAREKSSPLWLGAAALSFGIFIKITSELLKHEVRGIDSSILTAVAAMRRPWLTGVAVDRRTGVSLKSVKCSSRSASKNTTRRVTSTYKGF